MYGFVLFHPPDKSVHPMTTAHEGRAVVNKRGRRQIIVTGSSGYEPLRRWIITFNDEPSPRHTSPIHWCAAKSRWSLDRSDTAALVTHQDVFCHLLRVNRTGSSNVC
jgi:hypothetical protein